MTHLAPLLGVVLLKLWNCFSESDLSKRNVRACDSVYCLVILFICAFSFTRDHNESKVLRVTFCKTDTPEIHDPPQFP